MRFFLLSAVAIAILALASGREVRADAYDFVPQNGQTSNIPGALIIHKDQPIADLPFWKRRPELLKKIREDREIIVAVKREDVEETTPSREPQIRFTMTGAGLVRRSKEFCFGVSQQYPKLKDVSDHFKTVTFDSASRQLFLVTEALGYQARMVLRVLPVTEDWRSELQWEVIWGAFKGMTGVIGFERLDPTRTEMSLNARYEAAQLPLPKILMGFALEVITRKIAEKMRTFIEEAPANALDDNHRSDVKNDPSTLPGPSSIHLPPGFSISVFAQDVPDAREMTLSPEGTLFVGTLSAGKVYAIEGAASSAAKGERAHPAKTIASGLTEPNGVAVKEGALFVAEMSRVLKFPGIEKDLAHPPKPVVIRDDYPKNRAHSWKYMALGPDGWLYIPVGAPCNVCQEKDPIFASITRLSLDGKKREIVASGIRNTVGFDWDPKTKQLWFTDNGRDNLGDDQPADELNHLTKKGQNFGFPFCHQGDLPDPAFGKGVDCSSHGPYVQPAQKLGAHVAPLGMKFYSGPMFPEAYRGRIFIAEHGSWNRSKKDGYRVSMVTLDAGGRAIRYEPFAEGWLQGQNAWGRPVDVLVMPDGSLLVSDDESGAIYRIAYRAPGA